MDYGKLLKAAIGENESYRAIAYGADINNETINFQTALRHLGYETSYKTPRSYPSPIPNKEIRRADWDVGICMDVVKILDNVDIVVYGTADGDLAPSLEYVKLCGKQAHVLACGISRDLKTIANSYKEITEDLLEEKR